MLMLMMMMMMVMMMMMMMMMMAIIDTIISTSVQNHALTNTGSVLDVLQMNGCCVSHV